MLTHSFILKKSRIQIKLLLQHLKYTWLITFKIISIFCELSNQHHAEPNQKAKIKVDVADEQVPFRL